MLTVLLLGLGFEEELQDLAFSQTAHDIVKGAMLLSLGTGAVGFATGGETFDVGSAQQIRGNGEPTQERGLTLAQREGRSAVEPVYLSQLLG